MGVEPRVQDRVVVENINVPGRTSTVDGVKYREVRRAMLATLPRSEPGFTQAEMIAAVAATVDPTMFPGGAKAAWWSKSVQLDLEAKGVVVRTGKRPLRWHQVR